MRRPMPRLAPLLLALVAPIAARAASDPDVVPQGRYACWTAGAATGPAVIDHPDHSFTIVRGSSYLSAAGGGTYLLASDLLIFTRGPLKDMRLHRRPEGFWQQIARDGEPGQLKCSRVGAAAELPP